MKIILASSSLRRKALLEEIGLKFLVKPSNIPEKLNPRLGPAAQAEQLSLQKAKAVAPRFQDAVIIAADTIVVLENDIIGKPVSVEHARKILGKLNGRMQIVITGFTILNTKTGKSVTKSVETKIYMRKLSGKEIDAYLKREYVLDKAGGYGIQGIGAIFFDRIEGDYTNVVGLPLPALARELKKFDVSLL